MTRHWLAQDRGLSSELLAWLLHTTQACPSPTSRDLLPRFEPGPRGKGERAKETPYPFPRHQPQISHDTCPSVVIRRNTRHTADENHQVTQAHAPHALYHATIMQYTHSRYLIKKKHIHPPKIPQTQPCPILIQLPSRTRTVKSPQKPTTRTPRNGNSGRGGGGEERGGLGSLAQR